MTWIPWLIVDFPVSLFVLDWAAGQDSEIAALTVVAIAGGALWAFYGSIVYKVFQVIAFRMGHRKSVLTEPED